MKRSAEKDEPSMEATLAYLAENNTPITPQNFVQVMLLLRNLQVAGVLTINALSVVNTVLSKRKEFKLTPEYWRQRFIMDLCPLMALSKFNEEVRATRYQQGEEGVIKWMEIKEDELKKYTNELIEYWDSMSKESNQFYVFVSHLIVYIAVSNASLIFTNNSFSFSCNVKYRMTENTLTPVISSIAMSRESKKIDYTYWPVEIKNLFNFESLNFWSGFDNNLQFHTASVYPDTAFIAVRIIYNLLVNGWRVSNDIKGDIPSHIMSCVTCGNIGTNLQKCGGCINATTVYCNNKCQSMDWKQHSKVCQ